MWWWLAGCATPDPRVPALEAEVAELRERVQALEDRPAMQLEDVLEAMQPPAPRPSPTGAPVELTPAMLQDSEELARSGRLVLHQGPDGAFDGFRVSAIRRGSLPDRIGLENGDILHAVNERELTSMESALDAYSGIVASPPADVRLRITRRGAPVELTVPITAGDSSQPDNP